MEWQNQKILIKLEIGLDVTTSHPHVATSLIECTLQHRWPKFIRIKTILSIIETLSFLLFSFIFFICQTIFLDSKKKGYVMTHSSPCREEGDILKKIIN